MKGDLPPSSKTGACGCCGGGADGAAYFVEPGEAILLTSGALTNASPVVPSPVRY